MPCPPRRGLCHLQPGALPGGLVARLYVKDAIVGEAGELHVSTDLDGLGGHATADVLHDGFLHALRQNLHRLPPVYLRASRCAISPLRLEVAAYSPAAVFLSMRKILCIYASSPVHFDVRPPVQYASMCI